VAKNKFGSKGMQYLEKKVSEREESDPLELTTAFLYQKGFIQPAKNEFSNEKNVWKFGNLGERMILNLISSWETSTSKKLSNIRYIEENENKSGTECIIEMFDIEKKTVPFGFSRVTSSTSHDFNSEIFKFRSSDNKKLSLEYTTIPSTSNDMLISWMDFIIEFFNKVGLNTDDLEVEYQKLEDHPEAEHYFFERYSIKNIYHFGVEEIATVSNKIDFEFENYDKRFPDDKKQKCFVHDDFRNTDGFPHIIEILIDVNKFILAVLLNNYHQERVRTSIVTSLKLSPQLAPITCAVFPLSNIDKNVLAASEKIYNSFSNAFETIQDEKGTLEMRIIQYNELGIPFYVAVDRHLVDDQLYILFDNKFGTKAELSEDEIADYICSKKDE